MATSKFLSIALGYPKKHLRHDSVSETGDLRAYNIPADLPIACFTYRVIKPVVDLLIVFLGLPFLLPMGLLIAAAIRITSRGPILYRHRRIGQFQQAICVWKFRTMYEDSEQLLARHLDADPDAQREWSETHKLRSDPRVTPIGRFLRKSSLDEIPQIFNVLAGEMSIVGPRPVVEKEKLKYGIHFDTYSYALPGITGLWQVSGRCDLTYTERVSLDVQYVNQWSLWMELRILLKTILVVVDRGGAY